VYGAAVRIAVFGPVGESESALDRAVALAFGTLLCDRVVFLGQPELVSSRQPEAGLDEETLWLKSLRCLDADADVIDRFVASERHKLDWARVELLGDGQSSSVALSGGRRLLVCASDRASTTADARVVVFRSDGDRGHSSERRGDGLWLSPGNLDHAGIVLVSDEGELSVAVYDARGQELDRNVLS
jgi:hypothetical protein